MITLANRVLRENCSRMIQRSGAFFLAYSWKCSLSALIFSHSVLCSSSMVSSFFLISNRHKSFCLNAHLGRLAWEERRKEQVMSFRRVHGLSKKSAAMGLEVNGLVEAQTKKSTCMGNFHDSLSQFEDSHFVESYVTPFSKKQKLSFFRTSSGSCFIRPYWKGQYFYILNLIIIWSTAGVLLYTFVFTVGFTLIRFYGY